MFILLIIGFIVDLNRNGSFWITVYRVSFVLCYFHPSTLADGFIPF